MKGILKSKALSFLLIVSFAFTYIIPSMEWVNAMSLSILPEGFTNVAIGNESSSAATFDEESGIFTVNGSGEYIAKDPGKTDNYQLVSYEVEGDATIVAKLSDFDMSNAKYGQAGVIIRSDNSTVNADYFAVYVEPSKNQYRYAFRDTSTGGTGAQQLSNLTAEDKDVYIKLTKSGTSYKYYVATDADFNNILASGGQTIKAESNTWNLGFVVSNGGSQNDAVAKFSDVIISNSTGVVYPSDDKVEDDVVTPDEPEEDVEDEVEAVLPKNFTNVNIGNDEELAFATYNKKSGMFTINGSGRLIGKDPNATDSYQYVSCAVEGDATVIARLVDFDMSAAKNGQAGVFIRANNTTNDADYFGVYVEPSKNQYRYAYRDTKNGKSGAAAISGLTAGNKNLYIKIVKDGTTFKYYISEDITFPAENTYSNSQNVSNTASAWNVGFVVSNGGSSNAAVAKFDNVRIETAKKVYFDSNLEEMPVSTVENLVATAGDSVVNLTWDAAEEATSYIVKRSTTKDGEFKEIAEVESTSYEDKNVTNFVSYFYKVVGKNEEGISHDSQIAKVLPNNSNSENILFEDEAAVFTMKEEPNDTVFTPVITLAGHTDTDGTIEVVQDGNVVVDAEFKAANEEFKYNLSLNVGRNDIKIYHINKNGEKSIKSYNIVYLLPSDYDIIVDSNYKGTSNRDIIGKEIYSTVTEAINSINKKNTERKTIFIKNGEYKEKITIEAPYITIIGEDSENTVLTYDAANGTINPETGEKYGTSKSASIIIKSKAKGFMAENVTIENCFEEKGEENEQAVALNNQADESIFVNCRFIGNQDTLLADASSSSPARQYYYKCYIEGDVDFIFGRAQAVFDDCDITSYNRGSAPKNGWITAADTWASDAYGYVIMNSRLIGLDDIADESVALGRPWRPSSQTREITPSVVYVNCYMGSHITTEGWDDMGENSLAADSRFYEFASYGPGAKDSETRAVLTIEEAKAYTMENVFATTAASGDTYKSDWNPTKGNNSLDAAFEAVVKAERIEVETVDITLVEGETKELIAKVYPENTTEKTLVFESSDENIAVVSEDGVVTAIAEGQVVITIRTGNIKSSVKVAVSKAEVPEIPEVPEVPEIPEAPETPETPETPEVPDTPEAPEASEAPEAPEAPEVPETSETPSVDDNTDIPSKEENNIKTESIPNTGGTSSAVVVLVAVVLVIVGVIFLGKKKS